MKSILAVLLLGAALASPSYGEEGLVLQNIVVKPGDTLWAIANTYLKDPTRWNEILQHNSLPTSDPTVALPGMTLRVPVDLIKESLRSARLIKLVNEVLFRKRQTADWKGAKKGMDLYPQDGLRTMAESEAQVRFSEGEVLTVNADSMVILNPPRKDIDLQLVKGEVKGVTARTLTATAMIKPKTKGTTYTARVKDDLTTQVRVTKGRAEVEAKGKQVEVGAGFAVEVPFDMPPSEPLQVPEMADVKIAAVPVPKLGASTDLRAAAEASSAKAPPLAAPGKAGAELKKSLVVLNGTTLSVNVPAGRTAPPRPGAGSTAGRLFPEAAPSQEPVSVGGMIQEYHLQVAREAAFQNLVVDKRFSVLEDVDLNKMNLPAGKFYWRIALVDLLGFEGDFSPAKLVDLSKGVALEVRKPSEGERVSAEILSIEGTTVPGARVSVNGEPAAVDAGGRFKLSVALQPGPNALKVRAEALGKSVEVTRTVELAAP